MSITTYTVEELARGLNCSVRWLTEQVRAGKFPGRRIARHFCFTDSDVAEILELCANEFHKSKDVQHRPAVGLTSQSRRRLLSEARKTP